MTVLHLTDEEVPRLNRYEQLRGALNLPRVSVEPLARGIRVTLEPKPEGSTEVSRSVAARVVGALARVERAWGASLGSDLWPDEVVWDETRSVVWVGRGLLQPSGTDDELRKWSRQLDMVEALQSYGQLAAAAGARHPALQPLLRSDASNEDVIRQLREVAALRRSQGDLEAGLAHLQQAWALRPHDAGLCVELVRSACEAGQPRQIPQEVLDVLATAAHHRVDAGLALARFFQAGGDTRQALDLARRCTEVEPEHRAAWTAVARLAQASGEGNEVLRALESLARLGDEGALGQLWRHDRGAAFRVLDGWAGSWTPAVAALRLEQLHLTERAATLLQVFEDNRQELLTQGPDGFVDWVIDAARRVPGRALALRQSLHAEVFGPAPLPRSVELYLRACVMDGVLEPVAELADAAPNRVPNLLRARAYLDARRFTEVLLATEEHDKDAAAACLRVLAMLGATVEGKAFGERRWRSAIAAARGDAEGWLQVEADWASIKSALPKGSPVLDVARYLEGPESGAGPA